MQHINQYKIVVVAFIEPKPLGFEFPEWPNHITIVPPFIVSDIDEFANKVEEICANSEKISYEIGPIDLFGPDKDIVVNRLKESKELSSLHSKLTKIALTQDKDISTQYCFDNYKPHITHKQKPFPKENDKGIIESVYLVRYPLENKKAKKVVKVIQL